MTKKWLLLALSLQTSMALAAKPIALVEDAANTTPALQPLDYLSAGQVVDLGLQGTLSLGYMASCVQEKITGGRVTIGERESKVEKGKLVRTTVECDGGRLALAANQAKQSGAVAVRTLEASNDGGVVVYDVSPIITLPKSGRVIVKRVDVLGERHRIDVDAPAAETTAQLRLDLAQQNIQLTPGGTYMVSVGGLGQLFRVAEGAGRGTAPLVGRLVPF